MLALRFIAYSNLLISLIAGALTFGFSIHLQSNHSFLYAVVVFGATLFTYNLHRILRLREIQLNYSNRHLWIIKHPAILYLLAIVGIGISVAFYFIFFFTLPSLLMLGAVGVISVIYAWRFNISAKTLRELPYAKIYLIAISWTIVCFVWPLVNEGLNINDYWGVILSGILYIFSATIPFDIRDASFDSLHQKTIPHLVGEKQAKRIGLITLAVSYCLLCWYSAALIYDAFTITAYLGLGSLILFTRQKNHELYFSLLIDGWIIFYAVTLCSI